MRRSNAIARLREHRARLTELGAEHLYIFGSVARDRADGESDVDVVVDSLDGSPLGLFRLARIADELQRILGRPVDVVSKSGLSHARKFERRISPDLLNVY